MAHGADAAKRAAIVEVDRSGGLQWPCGTESALTNDMTRGQHGLDGCRLYLAHADGEDIAKDDVWDVLGGDVAVVSALWLNIIRCPNGMLQPAGTFLITCFHDFCFLIEERANQVVEVVLIAAGVAAVVEDDAGQLLTRRLLDGLQPMVNDSSRNAGGI